ncbi:AraC family transcriptional regulator, partial [Bacteroides sp. OttesenSCG-928-N06]|nr:AraC family transcriptional regulator [Bacteroides sp. OttesenSCG-928-N06]
MNIQENSRIEYRARINRVMDYIDQHLDQSMELKTIADIANFSPFHFHRIFSFLIGETPIDYIQRLRVEKAAWKLREATPETITEIAYGCGFGSVSLFSRTFKKHFGMTP